jgi:hypothetical protein
MKMQAKLARISAQRAQSALWFYTQRISAIIFAHIRKDGKDDWKMCPMLKN